MIRTKRRQLPIPAKYRKDYTLIQQGRRSALFALDVAPDADIFEVLLLGVDSFCWTYGSLQAATKKYTQLENSFAKREACELTP